MHQRIMLAGGGDERDSRPLDQRFAGWLGPSGRLLYLPIALDEREQSYAACLR